MALDNSASHSSPILIGQRKRKPRESCQKDATKLSQTNQFFFFNNCQNSSGSRLLSIGNLRSTTKETTTTSIDRARTGTRTSFSVGEMKVKKRSACTTTTTVYSTTLCGIRYIDLFFITFFKRCL